MSGFLGGAGFGLAVTLLVVGGAYAVSLALANGYTGGLSSSLTSSGRLVEVEEVKQLVPPVGLVQQVLVLEWV